MADTNTTTTYEVVETQTIRSWYRIEAESEGDACERYDQDGEHVDSTVLETLVNASRAS